MNILELSTHHGRRHDDDDVPEQEHSISKYSE